MIHLLRFLLHAPHLVCHLHHHLDRVWGCLHRLHLAGHRQFGRSDAHVFANIFITHRCTAQELGHGVASLAQIESVEELFMLLHISLGTTFQLIHRQHTIGDRVGSHRIDAGANILIAIRHAHRVKLTCNLLVGQFLGIVLHTSHIVGRVRLVHLLAVETEFSGDAHLHGQRLHLERLLCGWLLVVSGNGIAELLVSIAKLTLLEWSGEVALCLCVGTALGYHRLAHIADGIYIKMWYRTHQLIWPIIAAERHLLARGVFQGTVGSEMDERIGMETLLYPLVCGNVSFRRILVGAMDELESIISLAWQWLRQQGDIAELQANYLGIILLAIGIRLEHRTILLNQSSQLSGTGRHLAHVVAFVLQSNQEIVERRNHLHARCGQGILTWSLEIDDGDALVAVLLGFQVHIPLYALHELVHTLWDAINLLQALLVDTMAEHHVWANGTINLWGDDALRHESSVHALLVVLPLFGQSVDIERSKQWDVLLFQELYKVVAQSAVRHIDHGIRLNAVGMMTCDKALELIDAIHDEAFLLESFLQVGSRAHKARQHYGRRILLI